MLLDNGTTSSLSPFYFHFLGKDRIDRFATIVRLNGRLPAKAPVNPHAKFHFGGAAIINKASMAAGWYGLPQYVINQHYIFIFDGKRNRCFVGFVQFFPDIVAVK